MAIVRRLCDYHQNDQINQLTTEKIREFLSETSRQRGWSPKTYRNCRQNLKCFFDWVCVTQGLRKNPVTTIAKPKLPKELPRFLTKEEAETILSGTRCYAWQSEALKQRNETIILTFLSTGLRLKELINLRPTDLDLSHKTLRVRHGKGKKDRFIPIHQRLVPVLKDHISRTKAKDWLFTGARSSKKLYPRDIQRICRLVSHDTNVKFTPHMLRHTFGRLATEGDLNIYKLKEIMGHAAISTTQIYQSVSTLGLARSLDKVELF